jgi:hypothetical protein
MLLVNGGRILPNMMVLAKLVDLGGMSALREATKGNDDNSGSGKFHVDGCVANVLFECWFLIL